MNPFVARAIAGGRRKGALDPKVWKGAHNQKGVSTRRSRKEFSIRRGFSFRRGFFVPVSYTHLTLPTILLV